MKRLVAAGLGLAILACATGRRAEGVPPGPGPLVGIYKIAIDEGNGVQRHARLSVWTERPDRLHVELIPPVGGVTYTLDAGGGKACVVDVAAAMAYVGDAGPDAIEALVGVRVSVAEAVEALLSGTAPPGLTVIRNGSLDGVLPEALRIDDGPRSIDLTRVRFTRGRTDPSALGRGAAPTGLPVRPLAGLVR